MGALTVESYICSDHYPVKMNSKRATKVFSHTVARHGISPHYRDNVIVDIDGVIVDFENCPQKCDYSGYPDTAKSLKRDMCPIMKGAVKYLLKIRRLGLHIVLYTSRVEAERRVTEKLLRKCGVPYDALVMDKPMGCCIIDDMAHQFVDWPTAFKAVVKRVKIARRGKRNDR